MGPIQQQFMVEVTGDERHPARHPVSSLEELNGLLDAWVRTVYHARFHSETRGTPQARPAAAGPSALPDPSGNGTRPPGARSCWFARPRPSTSKAWQVNCGWVIAVNIAADLVSWIRLHGSQQNQ